MQIFLTGSSGFIGSHLLKALLAHGHTVTCAVRALPALPLPAVRYVVADFLRSTHPEDWVPLIAGMEVVINTVGIIREHGEQTFETLHTVAPIALFEACMQSHVPLILQLSALGADEQATSHYHCSKKNADDFLERRHLPAFILQPSLVYGPGGASASLFNTLASLPLLATFGHGRQMVQPIHIDDVTDAILNLLPQRPLATSKIALVGPKAMTLTEYLVSLRQVMQLPAPWIITIPLPIARLAAKLLGCFKQALLDREMFEMLERGNTADASTITTLLRRPPRQVSEFIAPSQVSTLRQTALLNWILPVLRISLGLVWIITGIISFGIYPVSDSYVLLSRVGVSGWLAPWMLYGAAALDVTIGVALLFIRKKWIWGLQIAVIIAYSALIAWKLPEFMVHPYGPVLKNLPMLAAIWLLYNFEED